MDASTLAAATGATPAKAAQWAEPMTAAMNEFHITSDARQSMFLAQIGHESGGLRYTTEIWGPTPSQNRYEGRKDLGNTQPGDGYRFRGRGFIQVTGRTNYEKAGRALGVDLVNDPDLLSSPALCARSAAWWWTSHGLNAFADVGDIVGATKRINGGLNGIDDRQARWERAKRALA